MKKVLIATMLLWASQFSFAQQRPKGDIHDFIFPRLLTGNKELVVGTFKQQVLPHIMK